MLAVFVARHTIGKGNSATSKKLADIVTGTGLCERTIRRCVSELGNVVAVHHEPGKVPVWQFLITPPTKMSGVPPTKMSDTPDKNVRDPGQKCEGLHKEERPSSKDPSKNICSSDDEQGAAEFVSWYSGYARKIGRRDAEKAYRRLTAAQRKLLATNAPAWTAEFATRPSDKIPYPATFINKGAWEEPPPATTGPRIRTGADEILEALRG